MSDAQARFLQELESSLQDGSLRKLTLGRPVDPANSPERILARPVRLKDGLHLQATHRFERKDTVENIPVAGVRAWCAAQLGARFRTAFTATTKRDWQLTLGENGKADLKSHKPAVKELPNLEHDVPSGRLLDPLRAPWLQTLGVVDAHGRVRERMGDKFRQIARYAEILDALVEEVGWTPGRPRRVIDMGSGKGYLTFAAWQVLRRQRRLEAHVLGIEERPDLVRTTEAAAREHGCEGLSFVQGRIADAVIEGADAVIALHACNTATDDALLRGIRAGAELILAAPCCHKELRPQIDSGRGHGPLAPILRHGILRERFSEWLTDGLRALYLEFAGYDTRVIEFIPSEHTPKNLLIAAVKRQRPATPGLRDTIAAIKSQFGVATHALDPLLKPAAP